MSIRKALGAVKDQATIGIARVTGAVSPDLDVAIVRATSHDDAPPDDRHAREVLRLASAAAGAAPACVASIARRLSKTRDYVVAAKCLALLHRLASTSAPDPNAEGGVGSPLFLHELLRPILTGRRAGEPVLALLLDFRDEAHAASWDHSAFVRAYSTYLLDRVRFLVLLLPAPRFAADDARFNINGQPVPPQASASASAADDMDTEALLGRARHLRHLLDRLLACRPAGRAGTSRVVRAALQPLLRDSFRVYEDVAAVLALLLDRFFDMDYPNCVKAFETYVATAKQIDALRGFYAWCVDDAGVARAADFPPDVSRVDDKLLETMEQFLRERGRAGAGRASVSPTRSARESAVSAPGEGGDGDHVDDMNGIKALPAPPTRSSGAAPVRPVVVVPAAKEAVLVDLRESAATADEQGNKLALALFAAPPATTTNSNNNWVTFASESDADAAAPEPAVTSAWQTPAAEAGKADWEVALVETASNLSKQTASLGGGMDTLLLGGMYDQGAVRQHVAAQAASGSASSVALLLPAAPPVLMLPAPDGSVQQAAGGDPFAASLAVPPPSYVQMAEMERKQQLLVQEQQMWAQYRQGGMQGQPAGFNFNGGVAVVPYGGGGYGYGMPPMATAYNQQVGGYY